MDGTKATTQTPTEEEATAAFEGQLRYTAEMILHLVNEHQHYGDDCGDYLDAALDLSQRILSSSEDSFVNGLNYLAQPTSDNNINLNDFASDGPAPALRDYFRKFYPDLDQD